MDRSFRKFLLNHSLLHFLFGIIFFAIKILFKAFPIPGTIWLIFGFFYLFVLAIHWILVKSSEKRPQVFIRTFLVLIIVKLFVYVGFVSILILWNKTDAKGVIIVFSVLYFINLIHEIAAILNHLKFVKKAENKPAK